MSVITVIWLVLKILLLVILGLFGFILLILAFPFHLSLTGYYDGNDFSYEMQVKYAWLIPLDRILKSRLQPKTTTRAPDNQDAVKIQTSPKKLINFESKPPITDRVSQETQPSKPEDSTIRGQKKIDFQEILDWISWGLEQKDMFWRTFLKIFQLLHIQPLLLRGQLGLEDPAETAFLFSTIYTILPLVPFLSFQVQANYHEPALSGSIRFRCHISLLEFPLTMLLNRDVRRTLILIYRMSRPKSITMETAEI